MKDDEGGPQARVPSNEAEYARRYGQEAIKLLRCFVSPSWRVPDGALTVTVTLTMMAAEYELAQLIAHGK